VKKSVRKDLKGMFKSKKGYIGLTQRMSTWFIRCIKRAEALALLDLNGRHDPHNLCGHVVVHFERMWSHTLRHYSTAPCHDQCPCREQCENDDFDATDKDDVEDDASSDEDDDDEDDKDEPRKTKCTSGTWATCPRKKKLMEQEKPRMLLEPKDAIWPTLENVVMY
jgi:hypothetical protein